MTLKNVNRRLLPRDIVEKSRNQSVQENFNMKEKERISEQLKEKYIEDLQERNKKLKYQIQRITQILEENDEKQLEKIKQRQKNHHKNIKSIISKSINQNNPDILKRELENVYKQIKNYEREIQKVENFRVGSKNSSDEISKLSSLRHEKLEHLERLNQQLSDLSNLQAVNSKKLKNNMGRQHYENQIVKIGDQLKVLREKLRAMEEREKKKLSNAKKQLQFINKLQNQLVQKGISMDEIQELKKNNFFIQIKNIMNKEKDQDRQDSPSLKVNNDDQSTEEQHITFEKLEEMKNQIKLYKKLHQDYEKRLQNVQKEKGDVDKIISEKKKINQQKNDEIQTLLNEINQVKQLVRKNFSVSDGTLPGNPDSIRKLHRKKVLEASQSPSKEKEGQKNSTKPLNSRRSKA